MQREFGDYKFYSKDNKIITITNKKTGDEFKVPVIEALNFYNDLASKENKKNIADIKDFLVHLLYQLNYNIIKFCGEDFAPEWSNNYKFTLQSNLDRIKLGHYFDEENNPGDYIQYYLYPVNSTELGYGLIFQILYSNNVLWELQITSKSVSNFDIQKEDLPKRAVFTLSNINTTAPNVICNKVQELIFKMIKIAIKELVEE